MEGKSIEKRVYQIIIVCLLVVLVIFLVKGQTGNYQISLDKVLDTRTGETYTVEVSNTSDGQIWIWSYIGKPTKTFNYEKKTERIIKDLEKGR